ncbi:hypothetical protein [Prosthecomicrobium sp. N25]
MEVSAGIGMLIALVVVGRMVWKSNQGCVCCKEDEVTMAEILADRRRHD